jgi:DNA-directed RNA polymerase specialized sigma subunit
MNEKTGCFFWEESTLKKDIYKKNTEKLLENYTEMKRSCEYYTALIESDSLSIRKREAARAKRDRMQNAIAAVDSAMNVLNHTEREVLSLLFFEKEHTFFDVCEICALERSSIYRYRASGIEKMAKFLYGNP